MTEIPNDDVVELPCDEPPKDGKWRDDLHFLGDLTEEEIQEGNRLGEGIDPDDDEDNGGLGPMGTQTQAFTQAQELKSILTKHGVKCSIELQVGRSNRTGWGDDWFTRKVGLMNHHTAGSSKGLTPSLNVCKHGRTGLPGPLCNGYGGRDLIYRIICMGLGNHPGKGGPMTLSGYRIPADSARHLMWGTEWEHDGKSPWSAEMKEFMGRSNVAILEWMERPVIVSIEHKTWAGPRKPDRYLYTADTGQQEIQKWQEETGEEDDMTPDESKMLKTLYSTLVYDPTGDTAPIPKVLTYRNATMNDASVAAGEGKIPDVYGLLTQTHGLVKKLVAGVVQQIADEPDAAKRTAMAEKFLRSIDPE